MAEYKVEKKRFIFNAEFAPVVDFFQHQYEIIKDLQKDFPDWQVSGVEFTMQDKEHHISATFTSQKIIFECDEANKKIELLHDKIDKSIHAYSKHAPIDSFLRLGLRSYMFIPMKEIKKEELSDILKSKLYIHNDELEKIFPEKVTDLAYIIDYEDDELLYHFKCGPMPQEQVSGWVDFGNMQYRFKTKKEARDYLESFPQMSIFFDLDCYQREVEFKELSSFLKKASESCIQTTGKLKNYILETKK